MDGINLRQKGDVIFRKMAFRQADDFRTKKLSSYLPFSNIIVLNGCSNNGNFAFGLDFRYSQKSLLHLMLPN